MELLKEPPLKNYSGEDIARIMGDLSEAGWWIWYPKENWEYISPKFWDSLGYDYKLKKHHPSERMDLIFPEDMVKWLYEYDQHVQSNGEHPVCQKVRFRHQSGKTIFITLRGQVIEWGEDGDPVCVIGSHQDITELKTTQKKIEREKKLFQSVFTNSPIGMAIVGTDGKWLEVNDKVVEIVGYSREELMAMTFQDITHPDDLEEDLNFLNSVLEGKIDRYDMEKRYVTKGGGVTWVMLSVSFIDNGDDCFFLSQIKEINAEKKLENSLKNAVDKINSIED